MKNLWIETTIDEKEENKAMVRKLATRISQKKKK